MPTDLDVAGRADRVTGRTVYRQGRFEVRELRWHRPGERTLRFPLLRSPSFSCVVAVTEDRRAVLVENLHPVPGLHLLEIPGGRIEPGETPLAAARRELQEETGWTARTLRPLGRYFPNPHWGTYEGHFFLGERLTPGAAKPDPGESVRPRLIALADVYRRVHRGRLRGGSTLVGLSLAEPVFRSRGWLS
ncbi:MAG: NUDIX hydrolase [Thermoplasmata archaeon]